MTKSKKLIPVLAFYSTPMFISVYLVQAQAYKRLDLVRDGQLSSTGRIAIPDLEHAS